MAEAIARFVRRYAWSLARNALGWLLMLAAWPLGVLVPGPGGIPVFLIGFALVSFPGKRKLTSRVLRGRKYDIASTAVLQWVAVAAVVVVLAGPLVWLAWSGEKYELEQAPAWLAAAGVGGFLVVFLALMAGLWAVNWAISVVPRGRRVVRPWMRSKGIRLLPPRAGRRRRRGKLRDGKVWDRPAAVAVQEGSGLESSGLESSGQSEEILQIDDRYQRGARSLWYRIKPYWQRSVGLLLMAAIFFWMGRKLYTQWETVGDRVAEFSWSKFAITAVMFAVFLAAIRAAGWRKMLKGFGHRLPIAAALRIWSLSELARYIPGAIWQIVGRSYLVKPYGVRGSVSSTCQILELTTFMMANLIVASMCMLYFVWRLDNTTLPWVIGGMLLVPLVGLILHPKIFYTLVNAVLKKIGKSPIVTRLRGKKLVVLLMWSITGLLWQSLAVWVLVGGKLGLPIEKWWVVAGPYCLAWCAGFMLGFLAPGGLGIREWVFVVLLMVTLPESVKGQYDTPQQLQAYLIFIGLTLRLAVTLGEVMVLGVSSAFDYKGALGRADAPGRMSGNLVEMDEPATAASFASKAASRTMPPAPGAG